MANQLIKTQYPGVRCRVSQTRKTRTGHPDKYFTIRYKIGGKLTEEGLGWSSEGWNAEKAHLLLAEIKNGIKTGKGPSSLASMRAQAAAQKEAEARAERAQSIATMTLEEFLRGHYLPHAKKTKRTWLADSQRIEKRIIPRLGRMPLKAITPNDVQDMLDEIAETMAPATVKHHMCIVRQAFNLAAKTMADGKPFFTGANPAKGLRIPAVHNSRERFLTAEEADLIIQAARKLRRPDLHDAIVLSLNTGLRLGELMRLSWHDVDIRHGIVTVREEDMRKPGGKVPMNAAAREIFDARLKRRDAKDTLVFPPIFGLVQRNRLSHGFGNLAAALGLNEGVTDPRHRIVFHSLRHTFASWLALAGVDIYRIKTLMRHRTIAMTMRYAHLIPDATRDAVHKLRPPK